MIEYRGYTGVFEFDPELQLFSGHVVDLQDELYFEGDSVDALQASMQRAVDHYLEVCEARGDEPDRPFSGKLHLRLGSELHRAAAVAAAAEGKSLNSWLAEIVSDAAQPPRNSTPETGPSKRPALRPRRKATSTAGPGGRKK